MCPASAQQGQAAGQDATHNLGCHVAYNKHQCQNEATFAGAPEIVCMVVMPVAVSMVVVSRMGVVVVPGMGVVVVSRVGVVVVPCMGVVVMTRVFVVVVPFVVMTFVTMIVLMSFRVVVLSHLPILCLEDSIIA